MKFKLTIISALLVAAGCGGGSSSNDVNLVPTITGLMDVTISANESAPEVAITVADDGGANLVTLTATSSDQVLVGAAGLDLQGAGASRSLIITPNQDQTGTATITIDAIDAGGRGVQRSFVVTVEQQRVSFSTYFRTSFADQPQDAARDLNSRELVDDVVDDYADLLAP